MRSRTYLGGPQYPDRPLAVTRVSRKEITSHIKSADETGSEYYLQIARQIAEGKLAVHHRESVPYDLDRLTANVLDTPGFHYLAHGRRDSRDEPFARHYLGYALVKYKAQALAQWLVVVNELEVVRGDLGQPYSQYVASALLKDVALDDTRPGGLRVDTRHTLQEGRDQDFFISLGGIVRSGEWGEKGSYVEFSREDLIQEIDTRFGPRLENT